MINNFLSDGTAEYYYIGPVTVPEDDKSIQVSISKTLVLVSVICVPMMLCCKPLILYFTMPKHDHAAAGAEFDRIEAAEGEQNELVEGKDPEADAAADIKAYEAILNAEGGSDDGNHAIGEIFIHQLIETIEFVLGTVSNTASYLRLWALSLAHSQLADVFLEQLLILFWDNSKDSSAIKVGIFTFILWFGFMIVSFAVLMLMDVLECFLHTLRLHWVEFQNKFYLGGGYLYIPFSFTAVFEKEMKRTIA